MMQQTVLTSHLSPPLWMPANLSSLNRRFERHDAESLLRWGLATFQDDMVLATGFGPSGIVLMHMVARIRPQTEIFYLETDLFFPETLALRDQLARRLGLRFTAVHSGLSLGEQARRFGPELWRHSPDLCCRLRKVEPLGRFLAGKKGWITGLRRDQSPTRRQTQPLSWDYANQLLKLCPLAAWSKEQVWDYLDRFDLPVNSLHDQGYPSIGCLPCTTPVAAGQEERNGRWAGTDKLECGIHIQPDGSVVRAATNRL